MVQLARQKNRSQRIPEKQTGRKHIMRTITLEEHFASPAFFDGPARFLKERAEKIGGRYTYVVDRLCDLGDRRLAEMDAAGIDMQVLSLAAPGVEQMEAAEAVPMASATNDYLAEAVAKHPTRFAGFAALPGPVRARVCEATGLNKSWVCGRRQHMTLSPRFSALYGNLMDRIRDGSCGVFQ